MVISEWEKMEGMGCGEGDKKKELGKTRVRCNDKLGPGKEKSFSRGVDRKDM